MVIKINYSECYARNWTKERLDELTEMNYLTIQPYTNVYQWMDNICLNLIRYGIPSLDYLDQDTPKEQAKKLLKVIDELVLVGGRKARKTYLICRMIAQMMTLSILYDLKIVVYGFRWQGKDVPELQQEVQDALDVIGLKESKKKTVFDDGHYILKNNNHQPTWRFLNGSMISLRGIHNSRNTKISLKGLSKAGNADLVISWCEEANEFTDDEFNAINFAVRDYDYYLMIKSSNPDSEYQPVIKYCMERVPFNRQILENMGYQLKVIDEESKQKDGTVKVAHKLFEYANYQINPYLKPKDILEFTELKKNDPMKYLIWGIGMPGSLEGAVFSHYVNDLDKGENFKPVQFAAGLDLGQSDAPTGHPTALEVIGIDKNGRIKPVREYFHSNATMEHKTPDEIARDVLNTLITPFVEYRKLVRQAQYTTGDKLNRLNKEIEPLEDEVRAIQRDGLILHYDYGAGGKYMGDRMNEILRDEYGDYAQYITVKPVDKSVWFVKDRVDITISMMNDNTLLIDKNITPWLVKQMNIMKWKIPNNENSKHELQLIDINDDCWDALCYSFMDRAKQTLQRIKEHNSLYVPKGVSYD